MFSQYNITMKLYHTIHKNSTTYPKIQHLCDAPCFYLLRHTLGLLQSSFVKEMLIFLINSGSDIFIIHVFQNVSYIRAFFVRFVKTHFDAFVRRLGGCGDSRWSKDNCLSAGSTVSYLSVQTRARVLTLRPHASAVRTSSLATLERGDVFNKMEQKTTDGNVEKHKNISQSPNLRNLAFL